MHIQSFLLWRRHQECGFVQPDLASPNHAHHIARRTFSSSIDAAQICHLHGLLNSRWSDGQSHVYNMRRRPSYTLPEGFSPNEIVRFHLPLTIPRLSRHPCSLPRPIQRPTSSHARPLADLRAAPRPSVYRTPRQPPECDPFSSSKTSFIHCPSSLCGARLVLPFLHSTHSVDLTTSCLRQTSILFAHPATFDKSTYHSLTKTGSFVLQNNSLSDH
jgi:hypothetical protein